MVRRLLLSTVVAGALLALAGLVLASLALMTVSPWLGIAYGTLAAQLTTLISLALGLSGAHVVFTRWRRARVDGKRALVRDGVLTTASVVRRRLEIDKLRSELSFELRGGPSLRCYFNLWFMPAPGREVRMLWQQGCPSLLAFDAAGRAYSGLVEDVRAR